MTRVVVFGASGVQGAAQVAALAKTGHHPVAVSRNPKPLDIDGKQVETFTADFSDEEAIRASMKDAEVVFLNLPSTSFQETAPVIAAAETVGRAAASTPTVRMLIFNTSMPVPEEKRGIKSQDDRVDMRNILRQSGVPVVSIQ